MKPLVSNNLCKLRSHTGWWSTFLCHSVVTSCTLASIERVVITRVEHIHDNVVSVWHHSAVQFLSDSFPLLPRSLDRQLKPQDRWLGMTKRHSQPVPSLLILSTSAQVCNGLAYNIVLNTVTGFITSANKAEVMWSFCLCVILWVGLLSKYRADFIETWCYDWAYQSEELINFWWGSGPRYGYRIHF